MPSNKDIQTFVRNAQDRLQAPIDRYYEVVDKFGADSIQARVAQSITRADMERVVRQNHIEAMVMGNASTDLTPQAKRELQRIIGQDQAYMNRFMQELPNIPRGAAKVRADMYANTARGTVSQAAAFDLPIELPVYPRSDSLDCTWHCKCAISVKYLYGEGNANVYWQLDQTGGVEHCRSCVSLAAKWRPLKIRNGVIVGTKSVTEQELAILFKVMEQAGPSVFSKHTSFSVEHVA
jgi:hypothetical protein